MATTGAALGTTPPPPGGLTVQNGAFIGPDIAKASGEQKDAARNASDPGHHWVEFFGPPKYRQIEDKSQWSRESLSLPEVYNGSNNYLTVLLIEEMTTKNRLDFFRYVLPVRDLGFETRFSFSRIVFDSTIMPNMPEQSVSRVVTMNREQVTGALIRKGLALMLEHGFMRSPLGRQSYTYQLRQIRNAAVDSLLYTAISTLLEKNIPHAKWLELYGTSPSPSGLSMDAIEEVERFAILNKNPNGWDLVDASAKNKMSLNSREPNVWLLPVGLMSTITTLRGQAYHSRGENGLMQAHQQGMEALAREFNRRNNCTLFEIKTFTVPGVQRPIQLMERVKTIGEYFTMTFFSETGFLRSGRYTSKARSIYIYDESRDDDVEISLLDAIRATGRFPESGGVSRLDSSSKRARESDDMGDMFDTVPHVSDLTMAAHSETESKLMDFPDGVFGHLKGPRTDERRTAVLTGDAIRDFVDSMWGYFSRRFGQEYMFHVQMKTNKIRTYVDSLTFGDDAAFDDDHLVNSIGGDGFPSDLKAYVQKYAKPAGLQSYHGFQKLANSDVNLEQENLQLVKDAVDIVNNFSEVVVQLANEDRSRNLFMHASHVSPCVKGTYRDSQTEWVKSIIFQELFVRLGVHYLYVAKSTPPTELSDTDVETEDLVTRLVTKNILPDDKLKTKEGQIFYGRADYLSQLQEQAKMRIMQSLAGFSSDKAYMHQYLYCLLNYLKIDDAVFQNASNLPKLAPAVIKAVFYKEMRFDKAGSAFVNPFRVIQKLRNLVDDSDLNNKANIWTDLLTFAKSADARGPVRMSEITDGYLKSAIPNFFKVDGSVVSEPSVGAPSLDAVMSDGMADRLASRLAPRLASRLRPSAIVSETGLIYVPTHLVVSKQISKPYYMSIGGGTRRELYLALRQIRPTDPTGSPPDSDMFLFAQHGTNKGGVEMHHPFTDDTYQKNHAFIEAEYAGDAVLALFANLLIGQRLDLHSIKTFENLNLVIPFDVILYRPFMTYRMQSAICMKAGRETGEVLTSDANMTLGDDPLRKMHVGSFAVRFGCSITQPENVYIAEDIVCSGYVGGSGSKMFTDPQQFHQYAPTYTGPCIFARLLPYKYVSEIPVAVHLSDDKMATAESFPNGMIGKNWFVRYWSLPSNTPSRNGLGFSNRPVGANTLCFRGYQRSFDSMTERYTRTTLNTGHWGTNVGPGCARQRSSIGGVIQAMGESGRQVAPVTLAGM